MALNAREKLAAAILRAIEPPNGVAPYFGAMMRGLVRRELPGLGTIGVTKDGVMLWDAEFVEKTDVTELSGVLVHEVMHVVLKHHERAEALGVVPEPTPEAHALAFIANIAMDCSINTGLDKMVKLPACAVLPEKFKMPPKLTFEEYFDLLRKTAKITVTEVPAASGGWCGSCASHPVPGEPEDGKKNEDGRSEAEMERFRKQVAEDVKAAGEKNRGTIPAELQRWADAYLKPPKIDWRTKLARLVRAAVAYQSGQADYTWNRVSRRQAGVGFGVGRPIVPALHAPKPSAACVIDTSGSMAETDLSAALIEVRGVLAAVGAGVTVCICDAQVHGIQRVDNVEQAAKMLKGGGGTAMEPALEAVADLKEKPSVCIVLTDGYVDHPAEPPFSTIWCIIGQNKGFQPPFGEAVFVDTDA